MDLADERIVLDTKMNARVEAIDERHAPRRPVDLVVKQSNPESEFLWVIGRPPDSLAFARSDRSGGNERGIFLFRFRRLCCFRNFWKKDLVELFF